ncbi:MAG TPA: hypothetical protein VNN73_09650 [Blastocatellia bacterium]|nr:hypothetical protein [Blastocatellia bacterium]
MFIPRGKVLHENLATSYVLVDALVADLCEGGFSGTVEVTLSHSRAFVILVRGKAAAAVEEKYAVGDTPTVVDRASTVQLAAAARRERGRVSVYSYSTGLAEMIAARVSASALYTGLSTEFADLEKVIAKLSRERDRQWFIEIRTESGWSALARVKDDRCRLAVSENGAIREETDDLGLDENAPLRRLLDECSRANCVFDVYFKAATDEIESDQSLYESSQSQTAPPVSSLAAEREPVEVSDAVKEARAIYRSLALEESDKEVERENNNVASQVNEQKVSDEAARKDELAEAESFVQAATIGDKATTAGGQMRDGSTSEADEFAFVREEIQSEGEFQLAGDAMTMAEIKRLMGDIARTIEEATRAIEQRDSFSIYLRAGQLKIADRYPFLDPFGAEFEYLSGEIAFIGEATPEEFIAGLTEALKIAVEAVLQTSTQSARLRERINEDLRWLYNRHQHEFQQYGLDKTLGEIISA